MDPQDGWIFDEGFVIGEIDRNSWMVVGCYLELPNLQNASTETLLDWKQSIRTILRGMPRQVKYEFHFSKNSIFQFLLSSFANTTEKSKHKYVRYFRDQITKRFYQGMVSGALRKEVVYVYACQRFTSNPPQTLEEGVLKSYYQNQVQEFSKSLKQQLSNISVNLSALGSRAIPMLKIDYFRHLHAALNPLEAMKFDYNPDEQFDENLSIFNNCLNGNAISKIDDLKGKAHFYFNNLFHNIVVLKKTRPPKSTRPDLLWANICKLRSKNYRVKVTVERQDEQEVIAKNQTVLDRYLGKYRSKPKEEYFNHIQGRTVNIRKLSTGEIIPIQFEFLVHVFGETVDQLLTDTKSIRDGIIRMNGAQTYDLAEPSTIKNLWIKSLPGYCYTEYDQYYLEGDDSWVCDMIPLSSSFCGHHDSPEALFDGSDGSIVGLKTFIDNTPQNGVVFGASRMGKSVGVLCILIQTDPYYGFTVIVEEGKSYVMYTLMRGGKVLMISEDSYYRINPFDTQGLPWSGRIKAAASAVLSKAAGLPETEQAANVQTAIISEYIEIMIDDFFEEWSRENHEQIPSLAKDAITILEYKKEFMPENSNFIEAWAEWRDLKNEKSTVIERIKKNVSQAQITEFLKNSETEKIVRSLVFTHLKRSQYPTLSMLLSVMHKPRRNHDAQMVNNIRTLLRPWSQGNEYGNLMDGETNVDIEGDTLHFELGQLSDDSKLKPIIYFLISNFVRNIIITLPRGLRKRVVFEEVSRILKVKGGRELVEEFYAQMPKFSVWILSIVQNYSQFLETGTKKLLMNNSAMFLFFRMNSKSELEDIGKEIDLPKSTLETIRTYKRPQDCSPDNVYSSFCYYHLDEFRPLIGTTFNVVSEEMRYISSTTGLDVEKRDRELKSYPDPLEGVLEVLKKKGKNDESKK